MYDNGLDIRMHAGNCCGIKTICGLGTDPWRTEEARTEGNIVYTDANGCDFRSDKSFFSDEAPEETAWQRFNRYMEFLKVRRPDGLVEVTIQERYQSKWIPFLRRANFRKVAKYRNSNSGLTLITYVYEMKKDKKYRKPNMGPNPAPASYIW